MKAKKTKDHNDGKTFNFLTALIIVYSRLGMYWVLCDSNRIRNSTFLHALRILTAEADKQERKQQQ